MQCFACNAVWMHVLGCRPERNKRKFVADICPFVGEIKPTLCSELDCLHCTGEILFAIIEKPQTRRFEFINATVAVGQTFPQGQITLVMMY